MKNYTLSQVSSSQVAVTVKSPVNTRTAIVNATPEQFQKAQEAYNQGALIQDAFHFLTPNEREFLITGMTPTEFDSLFSER